MTESAFAALKGKWGGMFVQYKHVTNMSMTKSGEVYRYRSDSKIPSGAYVLTFFGGAADAQLKASVSTE
jgi:hypothetical protein